MSKLFKGKQFNIKISTTYMKKIPFVILYIKINTSEKDLLFYLTKQYKSERLGSIVINPINCAFSMVAGVNGLIVECPENKIVQNITQYINYLCKSIVKPNLYCSEKKGSYKKLVSDLKNIELNIIGKCKTFIKNNIDKESTKIPKLLNSLDTIQIKEREDVEHKCGKKCECNELCKMCVELDDIEKIDLIMLLGDSDFITSSEKNKICICGSCDVCLKLHQQSKIILSKLKIYRTLTKDLDEINKFVYLFTDLRGLNLKFNKTFDFDSSVVKKILESKCECCENKIEDKIEDKTKDKTEETEAKVLTTKTFKKQQHKKK